MVSYKRFIVIHVDGSEFNVSDNAPVFDEMEVVEAAAFDNLEQRLAAAEAERDEARNIAVNMMMRDRTIHELALKCSAAEAKIPRWIPTTEQLPVNRKAIYMVAIEGKYTTDQYGGWYSGDTWVRWPHPFPPTHWMYQIANPEVKGE